MTKKKIRSSVEAWESGQLGTDPDSVRVANVDPASVDDAAGLIQISIRFQKTLIDDFKRIAETQGIGYQPLMRQVLNQYVNEQKPTAKKPTVIVEYGSIEVEYEYPQKREYA